MPKKTVFISSTFKDLQTHRRLVWDKLRHFDVAVRGMEQFGARTERPLDTCIAEVEQSDVYVGIIAYRLGSIDPEARKPFTMLEYEKAIEQKMPVLIYIADDNVSAFSKAEMDDDARARRRLEAFKRRLRENHTIDTFTSPEDLVEKLTRDFGKHFPVRKEERNVEAADAAFTKAAHLLSEFKLTPKRLSGQELRLRLSLYSVFPASRNLCEQFNLPYGATVGSCIRKIIAPEIASYSGPNRIFAADGKVDALRAAMKAGKDTVDLYAQLRFVETDVLRERAEFFGRTVYYQPDPPDEDEGVWEPAEGKAILVFVKLA